jgi:PAS domain S-box-containing protein
VRKWQLNPEMFIGKTAADLFGPEAARPHIEATERALQGEYVIYEWETEFEGNKVYVQTSLSPLYDGEGRVRGVVGLGRDITDAKETLSALHASEERFGQLFNKMMDGFVIFQPVYNEKGEMISCRYLDVNPAYEEFIGMKKQDLIGKKLHSIYPDSDVQWFDKYKEVVETGKPKTFNIDHDPTGKFFTARCYKLNPEQHEFCVSIADITETMQHRRALIESEARFRQLFNNMSNGVAVYKAVDGGEDFVFVDFNKAAERIENISKKELIGRRVTEAFPAVKKTNLLEIFRRVYRTGNPERDSQFFYQDDRIFGWRENYTYKLSTGEIVALYDDITERKQAEEEIKQLNRELEQRVERRTEELKKAYEELRQSKEKISEAYRKEKELSDLQSRFITMISHEYRTPLTVVLSSATLIERRHKKGNHEKIDKYVDKIKGAVDDLTKLLEDVLIIGRSDGKVKLNIQPVDAQNVTSEIIDDLKSMEEYSQKTELIINGDVSDFKTDIKLFRQIVINLLSNAFKFSPEDSQIKIIFEENKRIHKLTVIDHGSGIPEEDINKLFEPFHRGINAKEIQGTGLGMAIVDKCVKSLGAELSIESKSGEGTKATVTFQ